MIQCFSRKLKKLNYPSSLSPRLQVRDVTTVELSVGIAFPLHQDGFQEESDLSWPVLKNRPETNNKINFYCAEFFLQTNHKHVGKSHQHYYLFRLPETTKATGLELLQ